MIQILQFLPTRCLLQLTKVCHCFLELASRVIYSRLVAAPLFEHGKVILECYHPSAQFSEPYLFCDCLGKPTLSRERGVYGSLHLNSTQNSCYEKLSRLYSRFKPARTDDNAQPIQISQPADVNVDEEAINIMQEEVSETYPVPSEREDDLIWRVVNMEAHELFSQLCISAAIVELGPRRDVFLNCIDILKKSTVRIWRHWLLEASNSQKGNEKPHVIGKSNSEYAVASDRDDNFECIIWADRGQNVGIKVRVRERGWKNPPTLVHKDEDQAVSYVLELEGR